MPGVYKLLYSEKLVSSLCFQIQFVPLLRGHTADVLCIAQAPPSVLATGDFDGVVIIWNVESGAVRHKLTPPALAAAAAAAGAAPSYGGAVQVESSLPIA